MKEEHILLGHGSGGKLTHSLIKDTFLKCFSNATLNTLEDSAVLNAGNCKLAFTTDSYVVSPLFFPGGDIGRVAVCGTVNDLSVKGAIPLGISAGFIIEEGFSKKTLMRILSSMRKAASEAGVHIVTGDTKVVEHGKADGIFINTSGIGIIKKGINYSNLNIKNDDAIIISGSLGGHGVSVMNARNNLGFKSSIKSDVAPLNHLTMALSKIKGIHAMHDVTRGGLATVLNEVSETCGLSAQIFEDKIPVNSAVKIACDILGLDSLYVANEGKLVIFADKKYSSKIVSELRKFKYGKNAGIIGYMSKESGKTSVILNTKIGGARRLTMLEGEQLPRIC